MKPEEARECLPNATKTEIVATFNLRTWRHVFKERCAPAAQTQIRNLMKGVLREFNAVTPEIFDDLMELL
jgi:thymidylate synthase (FAD)